MRGVIDRIKWWELDSKLILQLSHYKVKYEFVPIETHQVLVYLGMLDGSKNTLEMPNMLGISEDEGSAILTQIDLS